MTRHYTIEEYWAKYWKTRSNTPIGCETLSALSIASKYKLLNWRQKWWYFVASTLVLMGVSQLA